MSPKSTDRKLRIVVVFLRPLADLKRRMNVWTDGRMVERADGRTGRWTNSQTFLDAFSHLYKRVCLSVRPSVRPSVGPSVRRSVTNELKPCKSAVFDQNYCQYQRERILWPCIRPC